MIFEIAGSWGWEPRPTWQNMWRRFSLTKSRLRAKNFVDKMLLPNRLDYHAVKMLTRICLRDVLTGNKYLIVTSYAFVLQNKGEFTQYPFFVRFRPFFLRFCFSLKKYALFHPQYYKSISALSRVLYKDKNFVQKFLVWRIRAIFQNRAVPLYKKIFSENFSSVCDCLVSADMDL